MYVHIQCHYIHDIGHSLNYACPCTNVREYCFTYYIEKKGLWTVDGNRLELNASSFLGTLT